MALTTFLFVLVVNKGRSVNLLKSSQNDEDVDEAKLSKIPTSKQWKEFQDQLQATKESLSNLKVENGALAIDAS